MKDMRKFHHQSDMLISMTANTQKLIQGWMTNGVIMATDFCHAQTGVMAKTWKPGCPNSGKMTARR